MVMIEVTFVDRHTGEYYCTTVEDDDFTYNPMLYCICNYASHKIARSFGISVKSLRFVSLRVL